MASAPLAKSPAAAASVKLLLRFSGGNAYVFSDGDQRVDVGPVAMPPGGARDKFNGHPMYLRLEKGTAVAHPDFPAPVSVPGPRAGIWETKGYDVVPCPDGNCPTASSLKIPPASAPRGDACDPVIRSATAGGVNNLYYLPNLLDLHAGAQSKANPAGLLESQIVLREGELVIDKASDCFTFRRGTADTRPAQSLVSGESGIHYEVAVKQYVDFRFYERGTQNVKAALRIEPSGGRLELSVRMLATSGLKPNANQPLPHFHQFYELVSGVPEQDQLELVFTPRAVRFKQASRSGRRAKPIHVLSPGSECPSARVGGPAAR